MKNDRLSEKRRINPAEIKKRLNTLPYSAIEMVEMKYENETSSQQWRHKMKTSAIIVEEIRKWRRNDVPKKAASKKRRGVKSAAAGGGGKHGGNSGGCWRRRNKAYQA